MITRSCVLSVRNFVLGYFREIFLIMPTIVGANIISCAGKQSLLVTLMSIIVVVVEVMVGLIS